PPQHHRTALPLPRMLVVPPVAAQPRPPLHHHAPTLRVRLSTPIWSHIGVIDPLESPICLHVGGGGGGGGEVAAERFGAGGDEVGADVFVAGVCLIRVARAVVEGRDPAGGEARDVRPAVLRDRGDPHGGQEVLYRRSAQTR